jgi:hypothetical protein
MFLSALSYQQRKVFLGLAKQVLNIDDGEIDSSEESALRSLCAEMSLSFNDDEYVEIGNLHEIYSELEAKKILLIELVALCYSNNEYHANQDAYTDKVAKALQLPLDDLRQVEKLLKQQSEIQTQFIDFVEN